MLSEHIEVDIICPSCKNRNTFLFSFEENEPLCNHCKGILFSFSVVIGYVYILSNKSMPGLLKIGHTTRSVEERVKELNSSTSVPEPFVVECFFTSENSVLDENLAHEYLKNYRLNNDREFFKLDLGDAVKSLVGLYNKKPIFVSMPDFSQTTIEITKNSRLEYLKDSISKRSEDSYTAMLKEYNERN